MESSPSIQLVEHVSESTNPAHDLTSSSTQELHVEVEKVLNEPEREIPITDSVNQKLPRAEYRKLKKKLKKKAIRQEIFKSKEQDINEETQEQKEARIKEERENDRQRLLWELRDKQFEREREEEIKKEKIRTVSEKISREIASRAFISENRSSGSMSQAPKSELSNDAQSPLPTNLDDSIEKESANCPFYLKTGACRYGDLCSREHPYPTHSKTILIKNMYGKMAQLVVDEESDNTLEFDEAEARKHFESFFEDIHPELLKFGNIQQLKICNNELPHLNGNVYVEYSTIAEASQAKEALDGRWYAGRQLTCEFVPIKKWKVAICGLFQRGRCSKGKECNFLHVYQNPKNLYQENDQRLGSTAIQTHIDSESNNNMSTDKVEAVKQSQSSDRHREDSKSTRRRSRSPYSSRSHKRHSSSRSPQRRRDASDSPNRRRSSRHRSRNRHRSRSSRRESSHRSTRSRSTERHRSSR
ncbi:hypothetical protein K7432_013260 [Basidiobolus ranarum]|uniref:Uncharacterized protein n=1 Tax=Basidiobolus ranarum TaxID=34480 RepID=A0ABR2WJP6_9FUNG